jgi:hypothetical protein
VEFGKKEDLRAANWRDYGGVLRVKRIIYYEKY